MAILISIQLSNGSCDVMLQFAQFVIPDILDLLKIKHCHSGPTDLSLGMVYSFQVNEIRFVP